MAQRKVKPIRPDVLLDDRALAQAEETLAEQFPSTELALTLYMHRLLQGDWCYVHEYKSWYHWTGKVWKAEATERLSARLRKLLQQLGYDAANTPDDKVRASHYKALLSFAKTAKQTLGHVETLLRGLCILDAAQLDNNPLLLNLQNGTLDLAELCQAQGLQDIRLYPHRKEDYCTKLCNASFNPAAQCSNWLSHMAFTTGSDADYIAMKQRAFGYCLSGEQTEEIFIIPFGSGGNGKSKEYETLAYVLGDYATFITAETLMEAKRSSAQASPDLMELPGKRLVLARESDDNARIATGRVKLLSGGDTIKARPLWGKEIEFKPTHTLILFTNHRPIIPDTSIGMWRRVALWPYTQSVIGPGAAVQRDTHWLEKLQAESDGILNWLLEGYLAQIKQGIGTCAAVQQATEEYQASQDYLGLFIAEGYVQDVNGFSILSAFYEEYKAWCAENNAHPLGKQRLGQRMEERGYKKAKSGHANVWAWRGLRKASAADMQPKEAAAPAQPTASAADTTSAALLDELTGGA